MISLNYVTGHCHTLLERMSAIGRMIDKMWDFDKQ